MSAAKHSRRKARGPTKYPGIVADAKALGVRWDALWRALERRRNSPAAESLRQRYAELKKSPNAARSDARVSIPARTEFVFLSEVDALAFEELCGGKAFRNGLAVTMTASKIFEFRGVVARSGADAASNAATNSKTP